MSSPRAKRFSGLNVKFFSLIASTWLLVGLWRLPEHASDRLLMALMVLGAPVLSIWFLHALGYFSSLRILPRQSDLLLIEAAVGLAAVTQYGLTIVCFGHFPISLERVWLSASAMAFVVFGAQLVAERTLLRCGAKKRIALLLTTKERLNLIEEIHCHGLGRCVQFLDAAEMKEAFAHGREDTIDTVVVSRGAVRELINGADLVRAHLAGIPIVDRRELSASLTGRIRLSDQDSWSFVVTATQQTPLLRAYAFAKNFVEPVLAVALGIVLMPLLAAVAIAIRVDSPGPIFYRQRRAGYLGRPFQLIKFRSMRIDSEAHGPRWAVEGDDRVTRIGRIIRALRIDELPQLWNVLCGEMSFVGPRPERPELSTKISETVPLFPIRTTIRPGITGWAQICAGYAASVEESKTKLEFDLFYIKHVSPRLDAIILCKTLLIALMGSERAKTKQILDPVADTVLSESNGRTVPVDSA